MQKMTHARRKTEVLGPTIDDNFCIRDLTDRTQRKILREPEDSATISGLQQRLYFKFKDYMREDKMLTENSVQSVESQTKWLMGVAARQNSDEMNGELQPEMQHLDKKLQALQRVCIERRPQRNRLNRKILGQIQPHEGLQGQIDINQQLISAICSLQCGSKIQNTLRCHNELLKIMDQSRQANGQLRAKIAEQTSNIRKVENAIQDRNNQISELNCQTKEVNKKCEELLAGSKELLERERAKWQLEMQEEERILHRLNVL